MNLSDLALKRPITMLMVYASLFVLGGIAFSKISLEFLPTMEGPNFWIQIPYRNATPTEVEKTIAVPAEELFETVPNLSRIDTVSQNSSCSIMLSFEWGTEMDFAYLEVRDRLERLKEHLPRESQDYFIWRFSSTDIEVMFLSFYRGGPVEELFEIVDDRIKTRLQRVEGVGQVTVWGHESMKVYIGRGNVTPTMLQIVRGEVVSIIERFKNTITVDRLGPQILNAEIKKLQQHPTVKDRIEAYLSLELPAPFNNLELPLIVS